MDAEAGRVRCCECRATKTGIVGWCERDICADCWSVHAKKCLCCQTSTFATIPNRHTKRATHE